MLLPIPGQREQHMRKPGGENRKTFSLATGWAIEHQEGEAQQGRKESREGSCRPCVKGRTLSYSTGHRGERQKWREILER